MIRPSKQATHEGGNTDEKYDVYMYEYSNA